MKRFVKFIFPADKTAFTIELSLRIKNVQYSLKFYTIQWASLHREDNKQTNNIPSWYYQPFTPISPLIGKKYIFSVIFQFEPFLCLLISFGEAGYWFPTAHKINNSSFIFLQTEQSGSSVLRLTFAQAFEREDWGNDLGFEKQNKFQKLNNRCIHFETMDFMPSQLRMCKLYKNSS